MRTRWTFFVHKNIEKGIGMPKFIRKFHVIYFILMGLVFCSCAKQTERVLTSVTSLSSTENAADENESETIFVEHSYEVNELGNIPIMMYHGIENIPSDETDFVGGNVDKDGYNRTADAFRKDLEFYYKSGYRMIRLSDYVDGKIFCEEGKSPIILTFDDGNSNNILVKGFDENGELLIDENSAVGILEEYKKKYPDYNVTATFFITKKLFRQEGNKKIIKWLIEHGYDIGNHTYEHVDLSKRDIAFAQNDIAMQYEFLKSLTGDKYVNIIALPLGQPNAFENPIVQSLYSYDLNGQIYTTRALMKVGWKPELSPFHKDVNLKYLMRVRAYDSNGDEYDLENTFKELENSRYVSDGNAEKITIKAADKGKLGNTHGLELDIKSP